MGQKVNPKIMRIGVIRTWGSRWFSEKEYIPRLQQDTELRKFLMEKLRETGISRVEIERGPVKLTVNIFVAKPGLVIGRSGAGIEELKKEIQTKIMNKGIYTKLGKTELVINVHEVDNPNLQAQIIVDAVRADLEKRMPYRRVLKTAVQRVMKAGAKGVKVQVSGRLNGSDIARTEALSQGQLPLHTIRADIDYSRGAARTIYGQIGVKVWIYRGEVFSKKKEEEVK